jgi:hypothetical protein
MTTYRFYFLDSAKHIQAAEEHDFADDQKAMDNGPGICVHHGWYVMEIWQATRLVHRQKIVEETPLC